MSERDTGAVIADHLQQRKKGDVEADLARNYSPDVVVLTPVGEFHGHDGIRHLAHILREHVPHDYEIPVCRSAGRFAYIEWRAREPGRSVEDGADSFVVEGGRIVFQSIHYSVMETMPSP
jgi:hypothetical protein